MPCRYLADAFPTETPVEHPQVQISIWRASAKHPQGIRQFSTDVQAIWSAPARHQGIICRCPKNFPGSSLQKKLNHDHYIDHWGIFPMPANIQTYASPADFYLSGGGPWKCDQDQIPKQVAKCFVPGSCKDRLMGGYHSYNHGGGPPVHTKGSFYQGRQQLLTLGLN